MDIPGLLRNVMVRGIELAQCEAEVVVVL